jgi:hypothetical protein
MPQHHDILELISGDDWTIICTVTQDDGITPLDLTSASNVEWMLLGIDGLPAITGNSATVQVQDPPTNGIINVILPHAVTMTLTPGRYCDATRIIMGDMRSVVSDGIIEVDANLFSTVDNP